ncbi:MAG: MFS transporter [Alphaproteobacteria bacterium]|jgi:MFS family permease|nr:MFS transporter [Alphaproteobacteria bacterium]
MQERDWRTPALVLVAGAAVLFLSLGIRQSYGLFLKPISDMLGGGRATFAFAIAVQVVMWGVAQPLLGPVADRIGVGRIVAAGGLLIAAGTAMVAWAGGQVALVAGLGILVGTGVGCASFAMVLAAVARRYPAEKRTLAFGICTAVGSFGMFAMVPVGQILQARFDWDGALLIMAVLALAILPLAWPLAGRPAAPAGAGQSLGQALAQALGHRGFWLLCGGYFVCGFHVTFIATHLPAYLVDRTLSFTTAAWALSLIGLFNVAGSLLAGVLGQRFRKKYLLSLIYAARAVVILAFITLPLSAASAYVFAAVIGVLWLSTVPLTTGLVGQIFGVRYLGTIGGLVFLSHQLGSFAGVWLGGYLFDATGSYDLVWWLSIGLGLLAAILHYPIDDRILVPQPAS